MNMGALSPTLEALSANVQNKNDYRIANRR